jgi:hypothetical protein
MEKAKETEDGSEKKTTKASNQDNGNHDINVNIRRRNDDDNDEEDEEDDDEEEDEDEEKVSSIPVVARRLL